ncbi:MAG TPA: glycosyltransferase family 8 protein [Rhodothermales bacterium]|nr:glycosyltransferase family 8 protein [Rhodothermales bacterium]
MSGENGARQHGPIVLVCAADDTYAMPLAVTLYSALAHVRSGSEIRLYVLDGGISERNRARLYHVCRSERVALQIEWVRPDASVLSGLEGCKWISPAAYLRLLIPDVVPEGLNKAIYLDCDLIVEADLAQLWEEEMGDQAVLAVRDFGVPYVSSRYGIRQYADLGLSADQPYLNSGVLVMNLKRWREECVREKVVQYVNAFREDLQFADQDGLNVVLAERWGMLEERWNVSPRLWRLDTSKRTGRDAAFREELGSMREEILTQPHIFHFCGASKPWHLRVTDGRDRVGAAELRWVYYLRVSGWRGSFASAVWLMKWRLGRLWLTAKTRSRPHRNKLRQRMGKLVPQNA